MDSNRFRSLRPRGPVRFGVSRRHCDAADAEEQVAARWGDIRRHLVNDGAGEDIVAVVEAAILHGEPGVGRQGRGIVATREGVLINEHLRHPPEATVVRLSDYPYILPLVKLGTVRPTYVFAAVDHLGADITLHQGDTARSETVDGGGYAGAQARHRRVERLWRPAAFRRRSRPHERPRGRRAAHRAGGRNGRRGGVRLWRGPLAPDVVTALPGRVVARVSQLHAGARGHRVREDEIGDLIDEEFEQRRRAAIDEIAARLSRRSGGIQGAPRKDWRWFAPS